MNFKENTKRFSAIKCPSKLRHTEQERLEAYTQLKSILVRNPRNSLSKHYKSISSNSNKDNFMGAHTQLNEILSRSKLRKKKEKMGVV